MGHNICLQVKKKRENTGFQVVERPQILRMFKKIFYICQTDLTSVNRDILKHDASNTYSKVSRYLVTRLQRLKIGLDCESETVLFRLFSSGLSPVG